MKIYYYVCAIIAFGLLLIRPADAGDLQSAATPAHLTVLQAAPVADD